MNPRLSIITIAWNSEKTIARTLESVVAQNCDPKLIEHWVIDGGSKDATIDLVKNFPHAKWISEADKGISDAFSKGVRRATGDWILFLNSDDRLADDNVLQEVLSELRDDADIAYGRVVIADRDTDQPVMTIGNERAWKYLWQRMTVPHPATFTRRTYFEKYGDFDPSFKIAMDYEMHLRGYGQSRYHYFPRVVTTMSTGGVSDTSRGKKEALECYRAKKKNGIGGWSSRLFWLGYQTTRPPVERVIRGTPLLGPLFSSWHKRVTRGF